MFGTTLMEAFRCSVEGNQSSWRLKRVPYEEKLSEWSLFSLKMLQGEENLMAAFQ